MQNLLIAILTSALALSSAVAQVDAPMVIVEAEDYAEMHGLQVIQRAEASGGRTVSYWEDPGTWIDLRFDLPVAGEYLISIRYALNWADTRRVVLLGGDELGEVELQGTGSWGDFETITLPFEPLELPAGSVTLRLLNRDSRGLSLDWAAMHAPEAPLADHALSADEREEVMRRVTEAAGPETRQVLDFGEVQMHATTAGGPAWARVGEHLLVSARAPGSEAPTILQRQTDHHQIAAMGGGQNEETLLIAITDGASLHLVALTDGTGELALPAPVIGDGGMRVVRARLSDGEDLHLPDGPWREETDYLETGGLHISAAPGMIVGPWDERGLEPELLLQTIECAGGNVGVVRFSPRWGTEKPHVGLESTEDGCVAREAMQRYPTLATFYDEGMFDLQIAADGTVAFHDLRSGESLVLRDGR